MWLIELDSYGGYWSR